MATRSYICIEKENGSVKGIYCHCDGYLTHNGAMLIDHYNSKARVEKLLKLGSISYLGERIDPSPDEIHTFDHPQAGVVIAYGRDRLEDKVEAKELELEELDKDPWIEYTYVFGKDGKWRYFAYNDYEKRGLIDLQEGIDKEFEEIGIERPEGVYGYYPPQFVRKLKKMQEEEKARDKKSTSSSEDLVL